MSVMDDTDPKADVDAMDSGDDDTTAVDADATESDAIDDDSPEGMFARNMAAFRRHASAVAKDLENHKPISKLVWLDAEDGEEPDVTVEFGGQSLYPKGARAESKAQLRDMAAHARRTSMSKTSAGQMDHHSDKAYTRMIERFEQSGITCKEEFAHEESYYVIVLGLGLGQYLDELIERTQCNVLVIVEPNRDLVYQSLFVVDWEAIFERLAERGAVEFILESDTTPSIGILQTVFRKHNPISLDGATIFLHLRTNFMNVVWKGFTEKLVTSIMGLGFFQDEINMIAQTYKNLEGGKTRLIAEDPVSPQVPAFIVANGPSLDKLMPFLKKNAENAVIFASGSVMKTLCENGLWADFWIMTERVWWVLPMVEEVQEQHGVGDTVFIGSSTMFPGVTDPFERFILFLRPGLSSTPLFKTQDDQVLKIPDPLAANSALSAALHLGFREFYFLGVDAGSQFQKRGHASGGFYAHPEREDGIPSLDMPVPGNFGGTVWTTPVLKWSKENLERLMVGKPGRRFYNLSDGALVEGATPMHPRAVKIAKIAKSKADLVSELHESCPVYPVETFEDRWDTVALIDEVPPFCRTMADIVKDADLSLNHYVHEIAQLLEPAKTTNPLAMLVRGTVFNMLMSFSWWNNRIADPEDRKVAQTIFKEEFEALTTHLAERAVDVFSGLENGEPWEEEFVE